MTKTGFACLAVCSIMIALAELGEAATSEHRPCQMTKVADLATLITPSNQILVEGSIKGEPIHFQIDTGTPLTLFDDAVISRFGISNNTREIMGYGFGGEVKVIRAQIPGLKVGQFNAGDIFLHVAETHFLNGDVYGLLGEDFLMSFDLDIDMAHDTIGLFKHNICPGEPTYWADKFSEADLSIYRNRIVVLVEINGVPVRALLDTGANRTVVSSAFVRRLGIDTDAPSMDKVGTSRGIDGHPVIEYQYRFSTIKVGDEEIKNPILRVSDMTPVKFNHNSMNRIQDKNLAEEMLLGADFIRSHHIYIETNKQKMYFTWNGRAIFSPPKEESAAIQ